jgi:hypothetical protein
MKGWILILKEVRLRSSLFSLIPDFDDTSFNLVINGKLYNEMINDIAVEINKC